MSYVSHELTHFVGGGLKGTPECEERQYDLLIKILRQGELGKIHPGGGILMAGKGVGTTLSSNKKVEAQQVCFCDIPIEDLGLHMRKYSQFGLAFTKKYLITKGASPLFYVSKIHSSPGHIFTQSYLLRNCPSLLKLYTIATVRTGSNSAMIEEQTRVVATSSRWRGR